MATHGLNGRLYARSDNLADHAILFIVQLVEVGNGYQVGYVAGGFGACGLGEPLAHQEALAAIKAPLA